MVMVLLQKFAPPNKSGRAITRCIFHVAFICMVASTHVQAQQTLKLAAVQQHLGGYAAGIMMQEIFKRAGLSLEIVQLPAMRASLEVSEGRLDGEIARSVLYGHSQPRLVRVEPSYYEWEIGATYLKSKGIEIRSEADLYKYSLGYVRGLKKFDDLAKEHSRATDTTSTSQLIAMLMRGRFEVAVEGVQEADYYIQKQGLASDVETTVWMSIPLFLFLHEKHRSLVPHLSATIRKMLISGELKKLQAAAILETRKVNF